MIKLEPDVGNQMQNIKCNCSIIIAVSQIHDYTIIYPITKKYKEFIIDLNHTLVINGSIISSQPCMTSLHFMLIYLLVEQQEGRVYTLIIILVLLYGSN